MSNPPFAVGCVQLNPGEDRSLNIERASAGVKAAVRGGASLVLLPEYASYLHASGTAMRANAMREQDDPALAHLRQLASDEGVWMLLGSVALATDGEKLVNRSFLISASGAIVARYDKIHMFDATLPGGRVIRESSSYLSGERAVVAETPWARLGMSICYDLRFPALFRSLAQAGAEVLVVPSAFTKATGAMHWKALLQARAIENAAYVIAPATCGAHPGGHETFGHSMVVDPNGRVIAEAGDEPTVIHATIDPEAMAVARSRIPSLTHDKPFGVEVT
jgi:predicted amidohydrolase